MTEKKCSFCGKENNALIAGSLKNDVYICDDCVSVAELKQMILSKNDAEIIHSLKRHMNKIVYNQNLPGEIFRKYPQNINYAYVNQNN